MGRGACRFAAVVGVLFVAGAYPGRALGAFEVDDFSALGQSLVNDFIETLAVSSDHRPLLSAAPLGSVVGLDIGLVVDAGIPPQRFRDSFAAAGLGALPPAVPVPRLMVHKGLPYGFDIGMSYIAFENAQAIGADAKWAFMPGGVATPAGALRLTMSFADVDFVKARSYKMDLLFSKGFGFIFEPYAGGGLQLINGDIDVPAASGGLPLNVLSHHSETAVHLFGGLPVKLGFIKVTGEYDYSFLSISTFSVKASLAL